jgi:ABC-2 type transport system ATP-binding protein
MWEVVRQLKEDGVTIILTTHYIEEAELMADRVGIIRGGRILMVDDKRAMMERMGTTEAIFALGEPLAAVPPALASFPLTLSADGRELCYRGGDGSGSGSAEVAELTKALVAAGVDYRGIEMRDSSLEDIFVDLVSAREEQGAA